MASLRGACCCRKKLLDFKAGTCLNSVPPPCNKLEAHNAFAASAFLLVFLCTQLWGQCVQASVGQQTLPTSVFQILPGLKLDDYTYSELMDLAGGAFDSRCLAAALLAALVFYPLSSICEKNATCISICLSQDAYIKLFVPVVADRRTYTLA